MQLHLHDIWLILYLKHKTNKTFRAKKGNEMQRTSISLRDKKRFNTQKSSLWHFAFWLPWYSTTEVDFQRRLWEYYVHINGQMAQRGYNASFMNFVNYN